MECPACGAQNPEGAEYCNLCFQGFRGESALQETPPETGAVPREQEPPAAPPTPTPALPDFIVQTRGEGAARAGAPPSAPKSPTGDVAPEPPAQPAAMPAPPPAKEPAAAAESREPGPPTASGPPGAPAIPGSRPVVEAAPATRSKFMRSFLIGAGVVAFLMLIVFVVLLVASGSATYRNEEIGMKFRYPSSWGETTAEEFSNYPGTNVQALSDAPQSDPLEANHVLIVSTFSMDYGSTWETFTAVLADGYARQVRDLLATTGIKATLSEPTFENITVDGNKAFSASVEAVFQGGESYVVRVVWMVHEDDTIVFEFMAKKPEGSPEELDKVLRTVEFFKVAGKTL